MNKIRLALIGFGSVGREFCRIIRERGSEWEDKFGCSFPITAITTASRGSLINPEGIDISRALEEITSYGRFREENPDRSDITSMEAAALDSNDVVVEISTLNIESGRPAADHISTALKAGKHVITANKGPVAFYYRELVELTRKADRRFLFEGVVMDGAPVFNLVRETLPGCTIKGFRGILNSTTNFILCSMEKGMTFEEALRNAQEMGWAEADPSMDIEGWDAAAKTAVLINVLMDGNLTPSRITRTGISGINSDQIRTAKRNNKVIKLICEGYLNKNGEVMGKVAPVALPESDRMAGIEGTSSLLELTTDLAGKVSIIIDDPKIGETAYALISDLLTICRQINLLND
ncbi:MAG: homoserine dehydrogenase [Dethiobacteria bacterium]